jgi:hypothetical protein
VLFPRCLASNWPNIRCLATQCMLVSEQLLANCCRYCFLIEILTVLSVCICGS